MVHPSCLLRTSRPSGTRTFGPSCGVSRRGAGYLSQVRLIGGSDKEDPGLSRIVRLLAALVTVLAIAGVAGVGALGVMLALDDAFARERAAARRPARPSA